MSTVEVNVVWEYHWVDDPGTDYSKKRGVRVVSRSYDDYASGKISGLISEELEEDTLGNEIWVRLSDSPLPERAVARLLANIGVLTEDEVAWDYLD